MSSMYPPSDPNQPPFDPSVSYGDHPLPPQEPYRSPSSKDGMPVQSSTGWGCLGCALGCLGVLVLVGILAGIGTWYLVQQVPDMAREGIAQAIKESELNDNDKRVVMEQVDRLVDGYKRGQIDLEKLGEFAESFAESPLMDLLIAFGAKVQYLDKSGLSADEKEEAERTLHRVARGVIEKQIKQEDLDVALNHISSRKPNGARAIRDQVTDEELRAFLRECKRLADEAHIPDDVPDVDIGQESKKLVDRALGVAPEEPAAKAQGPGERGPDKPEAEAAELGDRETQRPDPKKPVQAEAEPGVTPAPPSKPETAESPPTPAPAATPDPEVRGR